MQPAIKSLTLGKNKLNEDVLWEKDFREAGVLILGRPGLGKSELMLSMALQDAENGGPLLFIDPHDGVANFLRRIPEGRIQDVVVLSTRTGGAPFWPVFDIARKDDEQLTLAGLLNDAWRAQYGEQSIQARAESVLAHSLLAIPRKSGVSPVELLAMMSFRDYRNAALNEHALNGMEYALKAYFGGTVEAVGERTFQEWAQSVENKLSPLIDYDWLRRATTGTPPGSKKRTLLPSVLWDTNLSPRITRATLIRDGVILVEQEGEEGYAVIEFTDELDRYLLDKASGDVVTSEAFPEGIKTPTKFIRADTIDIALSLPGEAEMDQYGADLKGQVERRRRRRGWRRCVEFDLLPRDIVAREAIDIADLLDDGRIVLVEVPQTSGKRLMQTVATFALLAAVMRGQRQIALPPERRVPHSIYIDEAELFLSAGIDEILTQLRKAGVSTVLALQRLSQLGGRDDALREAVINTCGTIIAMSVGRNEVEDVAALIGVAEKELYELGRGDGIIASMEKDWALDKGKGFHASQLTPPENDRSADIRAASAERFYQTNEAADAVYELRVRQILKTQREGARDDADAKANTAKSGGKA